MSTSKSTGVADPALLAALSSGFGALAGAIDDLHRAALILRQESRPTEQRFRSPEDMRRIGDQLSARARSCQLAREAILAAYSQVPAATPS